MIYKNIRVTTSNQTLIPISYIEDYQDEKARGMFNIYKFKGDLKNRHLFDICNDICTYVIIENKESNILFSHPPSTMFKRGEKDIDSMGYMLMKTGKDLLYHFKPENFYRFKSIFSINIKHLKNKKAQHLNGSRKTRTKDLDKRYHINFFNRLYLKHFFKDKRRNIICIIDDVSSTGGTLLACQNSLKGLIQKHDIEIILFSLAH